MSGPARQQPKPPVSGSWYVAGFVFVAIAIANGNCAAADYPGVTICPLELRCDELLYETDETDVLCDRLPRDRPCVNAANASACLTAEFRRFVALAEQGMGASDAFVSITAAQLGEAARRR